MDMSKQVSEVNPYHKPFVECDYFKWLKEKQKNNIHVIETKREYPEDRFGFVEGVHTIDNRTLITLKYTEQFYFDFYNLGRGLK